MINPNTRKVDACTYVIVSVCLLGLVLFSQCTTGLTPKTSVNSKDTVEKGLKDYYRDFFPIGVAVTPQDLRNEEAKLILQHYNSLTAENHMKMGLIHPRENLYWWSAADSIVDFAQKHRMKVRGHTLVWHQQTPRWLFRDSATGTTVSKEVLLKRLRDHISTV